MNRRDVVAAAVLVIVAVANGIWWARGFPANGAPDEADHYAIVRSVAEHGRLPRYGEGEFVVALMDDARHRIADANDRRGLNRLQMQPKAVELRIPYVFVPQLPYALNGWVCKLLGGATTAMARFANTLWIALASLLVFLGARAAWPARPLAAFTAGVTLALWPQVTFVGAYVNDDAMAILAAAAVVSASLWCQTGPLTRGRTVALGGAAGLLFATKPYVLALAPLLAVWLWRRRSNVRRSLGLAGGVALLVCGPWFVRNAVLYGGDPTGQAFMRRQVSEFVHSLPAGVLAPQKMLFLKPDARRPNVTDIGRSWIQESLTSFWARFGWMDVRPPLLFAISGLGLVALALLASYGWAGGGTAGYSPGVFALPGFVLLVMGSMWNSYAVDFQPQGRYLLPCVPAVLLQITGSLGGLRNPSLARVLLIALLALFAVQNLLLRITVLR